jgi:hypothetical protein
MIHDRSHLKFDGNIPAGRSNQYGPAALLLREPDDIASRPHSTKIIFLKRVDLFWQTDQQSPP